MTENRDERQRRIVAKSTLKNDFDLAGGLALVATLAVAGWAWSRVAGLGEQTILDETQVAGQVEWFLSGRWELYRHEGHEYPAAAMFPGYQVMLSGLAALSRSTDVVALRQWTLAFGALACIALYGVARQLHGPAALLRTCQCVLLPIAFPFYFLLYTDICSLGLSVLSVRAALAQRLTVSALFLAAAVLTRQDNIVLAPFLWLITVSESRWAELSGAQARLQAFGKLLGEHLKTQWRIAGVVGLFAIFVVWHGRVGLDAPGQQPTSVSYENLMMVVLYACGLFLPLAIAQLPVVARSAKQHQLTAAAIVAVCLLLALGFTARHPWNANEGLLRNMLIHDLTRDVGARLVLGLATAYGIGMLITTELQRIRPAHLYTYWGLRLAPVLLIEPRYAMLPLSLFLLARKPKSTFVELSLLVWMLMLSVFLVAGITGQRFML